MVYLIKNIPAVQKLMPYLMKTRDSSSVYFKDSFDATNLVNFLNDKNKELNKIDKIDNNSILSTSVSKYNYNHFFMTAITRIIALRLHLNRFVAGKKIYQRHNIKLAYVVKKQFSDEGEESVTISTFERDSNIDEVSNIISPTIKGVKDSSDDEHGDFLDTFIKFPGFIISFVVKLMNFCIVIGHSPKFFRKMDIMQCSAFVSNLRSINLPTVPLHHLYDRGTCSVFITIGKIRKVEKSERYEVKISITMDEKVTDGFYLIKTWNLLQDILNHPEKLDERLEEVPIDE
ncbi:hypothetical protein ALNOE001_03090 [Candidatus Methanobinarius endosymbioticus]|uniref:2-oxoacid dehydrogenase acyltransferase catalytic domain-containing protein n=1 Tax=Candidatus Methanobinarius endosymbioticus TaxID=2006182 RepID=A0A366MDP5_9EURY|nr:hypothetical protein ALNOE001_03090 [Candidatus Methanobinarius endosymbioticus]